MHESSKALQDLQQKHSLELVEIQSNFKKQILDVEKENLSLLNRLDDKSEKFKRAES
jgi:hypothetical protein